jgi:Na+/H+-dicarboxylate symporter
MLALVTALYILFDPFITACNVAGNGALAIVFDKITAAFLKRPSKYDVKE